MIDLEQLRAFVRDVVREELAAHAKPAPVEVSIAEYAEARSISPSTVRAAIRAGRLPAKKYGRATRVPAHVEIGVCSAPAPQDARAESPDQFADRVLARLSGGRS